MKSKLILAVLLAASCTTPRNTDACTDVTIQYGLEVPPGYKVYSCPHPFYVPAHGWRYGMTSSGGQIFVTEGHEDLLPHEFSHAWDYFEGRGYKSDEWPDTKGHAPGRND